MRNCPSSSFLLERPSGSSFDSYQGEGRNGKPSVLLFIWQERKLEAEEVTSIRVDKRERIEANLALVEAAQWNKIEEEVYQINRFLNEPERVNRIEELSPQRIINIALSAFPLIPPLIHWWYVDGTAYSLPYQRNVLVPCEETFQ